MADINNTVLYNLQVNGAQEAQASLNSVGIGAAGAGQQMNQLTQSLKSTAPALIAAAAAAAKLASDLISDMAAFNDLSEKIHINASTLDAWDTRLLDVGADISVVERAIPIMAQRIRDLSRGLATSVESFEALGLSMDDLRNKTLEEQFYIIVDALHDVDDAQTRVALSREVFGRGALDLIPIIEQGGQALREYTEAAREVGLVMEDELYAQADEFETKMGLVGESIKVASMAVLSDAIPAMIEYANSLIEGLQGLQMWMNAADEARRQQQEWAEQTQGSLIYFQDEIEALRQLYIARDEIAAQMEAGEGDTKALAEEYQALSVQILATDQELNAVVEPILAVNTGLRDGWNDMLMYAAGLKGIADIIQENPQLFMRNSVFTGAAGRVAPESGAAGSGEDDEDDWRYSSPSEESAIGKFGTQLPEDAKNLSTLWSNISTKMTQMVSQEKEMVRLDQDRARVIEEALEDELRLYDEMIDKQNEYIEEQYESTKERQEQIARDLGDAFDGMFDNFDRLDDYVVDVIKGWAREMLKAFAIQGFTQLLTGGMGGVGGKIPGLMGGGKFV